MVDMDGSLSSALDLIKVCRFANDWMQVSDTIDCDDLAALVDALDRLKKDAKKKLSTKKAMQASIESDWQPTHTGSADQGIRRSHRIASAPRVASAGSLLVTEQDTESKSSNEDNIPSTMLPEASPYEHTTMNAALEILIEKPVLLHAHYNNQAPTEELYKTKMPRERHPTEQEPPSPTLYTTRSVVDGQDERTEVQTVQVRDGASNAQAHQAPGTDTQNQAAEDPDHIDRQLGTESPHHSLVNQLHLGLAEQDATNLPSFEDEFGEDVMHDFASPQFFNSAFEDYRLSSLHHDSQTDVQEATADSYEQHRIDPDHTKSFGNDPIVQGYVDLACRLSFRLPHKPVEDADHLDPRELLSPLVEERPLTSTLIHGLIYTLLPGPLRIFEVCSSAFDSEPSLEESPVDDFVAIIRWNADAVPLLVLGIGISKTLYILVGVQQKGENWLIILLSRDVCLYT
ncbi:hypothetical protein L13192_07100 [Pyrenophora tritici-repentis]|nr:hypothetical protein L13192_07100 [Pyrenophora tritici-repentis]